MRRLRAVLGFFDWRFLLCFGLAALSLALLLTVTIVAQENAVNGARLDRALSQNDALIAEGKADDAVIRQWQAESRESQDQLRALLVYIRAHGYYIPASLIPAEASGSDTIRAESHAEHSRRVARTGGDSPKAQGTTGQDSGSTGGNGSPSSGGNGSSSPGKSDHKAAKPEKDHGGGNDKPEKAHDDKPEKAKGGKK